MRNDILEFFNEVNNKRRFFPPEVQIEQFVDKIMRHATIIPVLEEGKISGLIAFYCNDTTRQKAFITAIAISENRKIKNLASFLMKAAIDMAKEMGFQTIEAEIYKSNPLSLRLADKFGMYPKEDKGNYYIVLRDLTTEPVSPSK